MPENFLFTSESVSEGHPDKVADRISDAILDAHLEQEPNARVAVETLVCPNTVVLAGETRSKKSPYYSEVVREAIRDIGYVEGVTQDFVADEVRIINNIHGQSAEIAQGVDSASGKEQGAGDQGLMFGYACNETRDLMPAPIYYSHLLIHAMAQLRKSGEKRLRPDGKSQLTFEYVDGKPARVDSIVLSHQHSPDLTREQLQEMVVNMIKVEIPHEWIDRDTKLYINPTGSFVSGGPGADTGLTGRKIIVDTYGGMARHGGGAFSGKDPSKVDRSAAYAARYLAKNIVAACMADKCEIQLAYAIGISEPLGIYVDTFGTAKQGLRDSDLVKTIRNSMDLTPAGIRNKLDLNKPIYSATSAYGHFGRTARSDGRFSWEKVDLVDILKKNV